MHLLRNSRKASTGDNSHRSAIRKHLKLARKGNLHAYRLLVAAYFNLATEYLYLCSWRRDEVLAQAEVVFRETWKRLPYLQRLSDWEQLLAATLMNVSHGPGSSRPVRRLERIDSLDRRSRFALVAYDLENWSYHWLGLALRQPREEVGHTLFRIRCQLLDFDPNQGNRSVRRLLVQVSEDIDGQVPARKRAPLQQRLSRNPTARDFKCRWLEVRCHLIEMRQQMRFSTEDRDIFLGSLEALSRETMMRPTLRTRARNLVSFAGAPIPATIAGMPGRSIQNAG